MSSSANSPHPSSSTAPKPQGTTTIVTNFILDQLKEHRLRCEKEGKKNRPLVVGIQGPQGCGKSYLTSQLPSSLSSLSPNPIRTATLSLDDLYLPHSSLVSLASSHPNNRLLQGRGQPGTHDLSLGIKVLQSLKNQKSGGKTNLPMFEKSLFGGEGDRIDKTVEVKGEVDVVVFEGWMVGFGSISNSDLEERYATDAGKKEGEGRTEFFKEHKIEDLRDINKRLKEYEIGLWKEIDCFVMLKPTRLEFVWEWRLEQEHNMKSLNGGIGMSDSQVKSFISRYMPGYELFQDSITSKEKGNSWSERGLEVEVGRGREVVGIGKF